jgi:hypothetical protein
MFETELSQAVESYCRLFLDVPEAELERKWVWKDHDREGIRFSFFVTLQELRQFAVKLASERTPLTPVQRILGQYHAAYLDLQAAVLGLSADDADKTPAEGEWPVHRVYAHILGADIGFSATVRYALEKHRAGSWTPEPMSGVDEPRIVGMGEAGYNTLMSGSLDEMLSFHRELHPKLVAEFASISETELDLPSTFWETTRFPIRHRLHRFEAHIIQHTVQIDKTLVAIGRAPSETQRLGRKIYAALAEAESAMIGVESVSPEIDSLAKVIADRTAEISTLLK